MWLARLAVEREDTEDYRRREEAAEKIAIEIESATDYKKNVDKELADNEEEEKAFSAVEWVENDTRTSNSTISNNNNDTAYSNNSNNKKSYEYQNKNYQNEK
jgi:hypothetical protein